ncbi:MAG: SdrD B-like domain-containing protein, partial [bacterium]
MKKIFDRAGTYGSILRIFIGFLLSFSITPEVKAEVWTTYTTDDGLANDYVLAIAISGNNKWFGTWVGVSKFDGIDWMTYIKGPYPLISNIVQAITIDGLGNKWFGTTEGVNKFDGSLSWDPYTLAEGLANNNVKSIAIDGSENKWFGTAGGVSMYGGNDWTSYTKDELKLGSENILAIAIDGDDKWFGTSLGVSRLDAAQQWHPYTIADGLVNNSVQAIAIDGSGNKWFGTHGGVSKFDGENWTIYTTADGLVNNNVLTIAIDGSGNKWFGTEAGVSKFNGNDWKTYTANDGLADNNVHAIAVDGDGNKWFGTNGGVSRFDDISISGNITDVGSEVINGVTVNLTGEETRTATTTAGGYYFNDLTPGSYTITPVKSSYTFIPLSINTGSLVGDIAEQNFTGDRSPNVPAVVTPLDGAVDISTGTALVWTGGDPDAGDTVTYALYFSSFSPPSFKIEQSSATYNPGGLNNNTTYYWKITAKDYYDVESPGPTWSFVTGGLPFPVYYIKGYIKNYGDEGISGVTVELTGLETRTTTTTAGGSYEFINLASGNYAVTPSSAGYLFTPPNMTYSPLDSNQDYQNFSIAGILTGEGEVEIWGGAKGYLRANETATIKMTPKMSGQVTIKIYTLRKKLVWKKEIYVTGGTQPLPVVWECKNTGSEQVASGTYIAHIKGA